MDTTTSKKLADYLASSKRSQNYVARAIGISAGALSAWLSGTYKGDNQKVSQAVATFLTREDGRKKALTVPIVETDVYRRIHLTMDIAAEETDIALITGHSGMGKTTAITLYAQRYGGIYIQVDKTFTQHQLIMVLAERLGISSRAPAAQITERIIHELEDRDTLVIIDEADYLSDGALEYLRQVVYDAGNTGLVLCGLPRLAGIIQNNRNDHDQLLSRIGVCLNIEEVSSDDMLSVIEASWPNLKKEVKAALIESSAIRFGSNPAPCLRTLEKLLKRLYLYTGRNGSEPHVKSVNEVSVMLMRRK